MIERLEKLKLSNPIKIKGSRVDIRASFWLGLFLSCATASGLVIGELAGLFSVGVSVSEPAANRFIPVIGVIVSCVESLSIILLKVSLPNLSFNLSISSGP